MPIKVGGTTITKLIVDGVEKKCVKVGSTCVFMKSTLVYVNLQYTKNVTAKEYTSCNSSGTDYSYTLKDLKLYCYIADTDVISLVTVNIRFNITGENGTVLCAVPAQTLTFTASGTKSLSYTNKATHDSSYNPGLYFSDTFGVTQADCVNSMGYSNSMKFTADTDVSTADKDIAMSQRVFTMTVGV